MTNGSHDCLAQARQLYHHFHANALHDSLLAVAKDVKNSMINELQKQAFISISIDEGSCGGVKTLTSTLNVPFQASLHSQFILTL